MTTTAEHVGELRLRRFRIGELPAEDAAQVERHTTECGACKGKLRALEDEQRGFEAAISLERFTGGVERARRVPRQRPRRALGFVAVAFAAAAGLVLVVRTMPGSDAPSGWNRTKGASVEAFLRVASADGTQQGYPPGATVKLRAGDRVRLGYRSAAARHLLAFSVDDAGVVTTLYQEPGRAAAEARWLDGSLEFTGSGRENVHLVLSSGPVDLGNVRGALPNSARFSWVLEKP